MRSGLGRHPVSRLPVEHADDQHRRDGENQRDRRRRGSADQQIEVGQHQGAEGSDQEGRQDWRDQRLPRPGVGPCPAEERDHRHRRQEVENDETDDGDAAAPGEQGEDRVQPENGERHDQHDCGGGLHRAGHPGSVEPVGARDPQRQPATVSERVLVPVARVVEGQDAGEQRSRHQDPRRGAGPAAERVGHGREEQGGAVTALQSLACFVGDLARTVGADHHPRDEGEERGDHSDREVGRARHGAGGVLGLGRVDRRGFEAEHRGDREHEGDSGGPGEQRRGREGRAGVQSFRATAGQQGHEGEGEQDGHFGADEDGQESRPEVDVERTEDLHQRHRHQRGRPPWRGEVQIGAAQARDDDAVDAVHGGLDDVVGPQGEQCRPGAESPAETPADVGVEGPGVSDVPAHRDEADREQCDDDADDEVGGRRSRAVAEPDGQRKCAGDPGERRLGGQDEEEDADHADRAAAKLPIGLGGRRGMRAARGLGHGVSARGCGLGHESLRWVARFGVQRGEAAGRGFVRQVGTDCGVPALT